MYICNFSYLIQIEYSGIQTNLTPAESPHRFSRFFIPPLQPEAHFFKIRTSAPSGSMRWRKFAHPLGAEAPFEKNHVSARSGSSHWIQCAFPLGAEGYFEKISYFRSKRKPVVNRSFRESSPLPPKKSYLLMKKV